MKDNFFNLLKNFGLYDKTIDFPIEKINLLYSMPVKVYRTDDSSKSVLFKEYSEELHEKIFKNDLKSPAIIDLGNSKRIDFVFDLLSKRGICDFEIKCINKNLKEVKICITDEENKVFTSEENVIFSEKSSDGFAEISFVPEKLTVFARYIHISLVCKDNCLNIVNMAASGLNSQVNNYQNLIKDKSSFSYVCLENKSTFERKNIDSEINKFISNWVIKENMYFIKNAFKDDPSVYNVFAGKDGEESVNIVVDLNEVCSINKISAIFGCDNEYFPKKLSLYVSDKETDLFGKNVKPLKTFEGEFEDGNFEFKFLPRTALFVRFEIEKGAHPYYGDKILGVISQLKVFGIKAAGGQFADNSVDLSFKFDVKNLKCKDHFGLGTNAWNLPLKSKMSKDSPAFMTDAHLAVEFDRLNRLKPAFVRIPVFIDYFIDDSDNAKGENNYKSGKFNFDSEQMKWLYKYFSAAKNAGSEIYLNFCGTKDRDIYNWFAVKNASKDISIAAPKDIILYSDAVIAFLTECLKRGYDNIKTVAFYKNINREGFACFGNKIKKYSDLINIIKKKIDKSDIKNSVKIISASLAGNAFEKNNFNEFCSGVAENTDGKIDLLSTEQYPSKHLLRYLNHFVYRETGDKYDNLIVNEFSEGYENIDGKLVRTNRYWHSQAGQFIEQTKNGFKGSADGLMSGAVKEDGKLVNNIEDVLFKIPSDTLDGISPRFKEIGLIMNYVKMHSGSMASYSSDSNIESRFGDETDARACGFVSPDGEVTILIESEYDLKDRTVYISLNDYKTRVFNKAQFAYMPDFPTLPAEEGKIPKVTEKILAQNGRLKITIPSNHTLTVLTTLPETKQLNLEKCGFAVKPGEKAELKVAEILGTDEREVEWSIEAGEGNVDQNGVFTALKDSIPNSFCAVKAALKSDPSVYNIALINIRN